MTVSKQDSLIPCQAGQLATDTRKAYFTAVAAQQSALYAEQVANIETQAMPQRLDIQMARRDAEATASSLGLTHAKGFINVFDAGYA